MDGLRTPDRGGLLADALRALDGDGGDTGEQFIELIIDDASDLVDHVRSRWADRYATVGRPETLPFGCRLR